MSQSPQYLHLKTMFSTVLLMLLAITVFFWYQNEQIVSPTHNVLGTASIGVTATVSGCLLNLDFIPEKRIPDTGNNSVQANVQIFDQSQQQVADYDVTTDNSGAVSTNLCDIGIFTQNGTYDFYIQGESHLRKAFRSVPSFEKVGTSLDFSNDGFLLAGEVSPIYDNEINSLDISALIQNYGDNLEKYDLNRDGVVNSLDISNGIYNLFRTGD